MSHDTEESEIPQRRLNACANNVDVPGTPVFFACVLGTMIAFNTLLWGSLRFPPLVQLSIQFVLHSIKVHCAQLWKTC